MVIYILIAVALAVLMILTIFDKFTPKEITDENKKKFYKQTTIIMLSADILSFVLFTIAELVEAVYKAFNIIAIILLILSVVFYFVRDWQFKKIESEKKNDNN